MSASNRCAAEPFNFSVLLFVLDGLRIEVLNEAVQHRGEDGHGFGIIDFMPTLGISMYTRPSDSGWRGVKNVRQFIWDGIHRSFIQYAFGTGAKVCYVV